MPRIRPISLTRSTLSLALLATLALAVPFAAAEAKPSDPVARSAGGDAPPLNPAIVGVPIVRTETALTKAANAIDAGNGAAAAGPLRASRRYLIRSYRGAKYLIAHAPPPDPEDRTSSARFRRMARRYIRASHERAHGRDGWIRAYGSGDAAGPVIADVPTAVFSVFASEYDAATTAIGMLPDTKGNLLIRVQTTVNTAVILRNRLVKIVAAAFPPGGDEARAAQEDEDAATFDVVMPGVAILLEDEIQQIRATQEDTSIPAASRAVLTNVLAADTQILNRVNTLWPPATED